MKRSGFAKPTPEKVKEIQARKMVKAVEKVSKANKLGKAPKNSLKVAKQPKKRKQKTERQKAEEALWQECRRLTRERWGTTCYTCNAENLESYNWQCGHSKPKGALPLRFKYDIRGLRPQCMRDNIHLGGLTDIFIAKLEQEDEGLAFLNDCCYIDPASNAWRIRQDIPSLGGKDATIFIQNLLQQYKNTHY